MEKFIGPLVLLSTAAGMVWIILLGWWMFGRSRLSIFRRVAAVFICAGVVVPLAMLPVWFWLDGAFEELAMMLWPTSIVLMALEGATSSQWGSIILVYAFSILGNVGLYGTVGMVVGGIWNWIRSKQSRTSGAQ